MAISAQNYGSKATHPKILYFLNTYIKQQLNLFLESWHGGCIVYSESNERSFKYRETRPLSVEFSGTKYRETLVNKLQGSELEDVANAIRRYISSRPNATETVEGVARWWLVRQRYEDSVEIVQQALNYLESSGKVTKLKVPGGKVVYCSPTTLKANTRH